MTMKRYYPGILLAVYLLSVIAISAFAQETTPKDSPSKEYIRFEPIARLSGQEMALEAMKVLNQYEYEEGWHGKHYKFSAANKDGALPKEKKALFDDWASGNGFEWIDPVWGDSVNDPVIQERLKGCDSFSADPVLYKENESLLIRRHRFYPHIGPVAVYTVDHIVNPDSSDQGRYLIIQVFNTIPTVVAESLISGNEIEVGSVFSRISSVFVDTNSCQYQLAPNLGHSYTAGYTEKSQPRLTGVGSYKGHIAFYEIYDFTRSNGLKALLWLFDKDDSLSTRRQLNLRTFR